MRMICKALLAAVGTLAIGGAAMAAGEKTHILNVTLPDGLVEQVRYTGDVAPKVVLVPVAAEPFAMFDQLAAGMDRQADAMLRQVATLAAQAPAMDGRIDQAALKDMPAGTVHYSFVSTTTGDGTCTQSVEMTSYGAGQAPKVVKQSSGDCTAMTRPVTPAVQPAAPAAPARVTPVKADAKPTEALKVRETI